MTDRELLELAAKAAGLNVKSYAVDTDDAFIHLIVGRKFTKEKIAWNPLADDGDALRLAVKLKINVLTPVGDGDRAMAIIGAGKSYDIATHTVDVAGDSYAATRRAIVLAAAEIGRSKE
jgi:hypothetical protein